MLSLGLMKVVGFVGGTKYCQNMSDELETLSIGHIKDGIADIALTAISQRGELFNRAKCGRVVMLGQRHDRRTPHQHAHRRAMGASV
jgi:hypothetical protein